MQQTWVLISYTKRSHDVSSLPNQTQNNSYNYTFQSDMNSSYSNYLFKTWNISWNQLKAQDTTARSVCSSEPLGHSTSLFSAPTPLCPLPGAPHVFEARAQVQQGFGPSLGDLSPLRLQLLGADATQAPYLEPRPPGIGHCPLDMPTYVNPHVSQTVRAR